MKQNNTPGRFILCRGNYKAYIPNPLPPELEWTPKLVRVLSDADTLLGRLSGDGKRLPNPHLLIRPFVAREAVMSSRIEGTQATLGELLAKEAGASIDRSPADLREVGNYVIALEYGIKRLKTLPLSLRLVRELHEKLMMGVRGNHATPGEFRRSQNWIGTPGCTLTNASYVPPSPDYLMDCLSHWEKFMHDKSIPPLAQIALLHYQFEAIHPFLDGNGRVGRLLIILFLIERSILPSPLLYISAFFEATRRDYYDRLRGVSEQGNWSAWLEYFLNGIARQSEDALSRSERINQKIMDWRKEFSGASSKVPLKLIDILASNPYLTITKASQRLEVAYTTIERAIKKLENLSVVTKVGKAKRDRVYCASSILEILDEPAKLTVSREL
ncbi:MAG: cell filamentation protein Fic [Elusimicrobia bacterium RIFCSPLOWO2_02_FULL_39_32]|nr:MAG: cell filamentation protein Fic [Elusimicrobia bacterium RIFCSPHIGHO2_02_FULL_39_36]OGR92413.1 MAG: cell filamentation protein Fic [Elusimicrobia bacterium RIFCSPLOWO2_02_FULL_39_32]OGR98956.1 MAG: cell filamentation protein Fic [Elusimicrobia bacterium RIFCSPLOWO2_12_FULL_39_28]